MGKKKSSGLLGRPSSKRLARRLEALLLEGRESVESFLEAATLAELREVLEESSSAELVNVLLDLRRSIVKAFFERVVVGRKRVAAPAVTLYHYRIYLTNPHPLQVGATNGETLPNYYAILGVPRDASAAEIAEAHKLLTRALATDAPVADEQDVNEKRRQEIAEAFGILRNPKRRETADRLLPGINYLYPKRESFWLDAVRGFLN